MKVVKKILAVILTASFLLSTVLTVAATEAENKVGNNDSGIAALMNAPKVNPLTGNETLPFNAAPGSPVLMNKENELLLYTSNKKGEPTKDDFVTVFEQINESTSYVGEGSVTPELDLFFVTAVALNAFGNGTDDHIYGGLSKRS